MNEAVEEKLIKKLPFELVDYIKLYTGDAYWRNGKFYKVTKLLKNDARYAILINMPRIKQVHNECFNDRKRGAVWFKLENGKFVTISVGYKHVWHEAGRVGGYFWVLQYNQTCTNHFIGI